MTELVAWIAGPISTIGVAGIAALWIVKAGAGWVLLRWWRERRASTER